MISVMKRFGFTFIAATLLIVGALGAEQAAPKADGHRMITDPKVYIPLREQMTTMEMKFVDVQIMAAEDKIDFKALQKALDQMKTASKKIQAINPSDSLTEPLQKLSGQIDGLQHDTKRKDRAMLKGHLDLVFETCFKCHQAHAPLM